MRVVVVVVRVVVPAGVVVVRVLARVGGVEEPVVGLRVLAGVLGAVLGLTTVVVVVVVETSSCTLRAGVEVELAVALLAPDPPLVAVLVPFSTAVSWSSAAVSWAWAWSTASWARSESRVAISWPSITCWPTLTSIWERVPPV